MLLNRFDRNPRIFETTRCGEPCPPNSDPLMFENRAESGAAPPLPPGAAFPSDDATVSSWSLLLFFSLVFSMNFLWIYRLFSPHFTSEIHFIFTEFFQIFFWACKFAKTKILFGLILHDMNETTARPGRIKGEYNLPVNRFSVERLFFKNPTPRKGIFRIQYMMEFLLCLRCVRVEALGNAQVYSFLTVLGCP